MKKSLSLFLAFLLMVSLNVALASEDLKLMTVEELKALRSEIDDELNSREGEIESSTVAQTDLTAEEFVKKIVEAGFPIKNIIVYTEETDPNNQLGRPNGYISKANFADDRCEQYDATDPEGGNFEVFKNVEDCTDRKEYIESVYKANSIFRMYMYQFDNVLFRLSRELTPSQAAEYENAVISILSNIPITPYKK